MKIPAYFTQNWARWANIAALIALAGALHGCAAQGDVDLDDLEGTAGNCSAHSDCPDGQECHLNMCSAPKSNVANLNFRFIPPGDSDYLPQFRNDVEIQPQDPTNFVLRPPLTIRSGESSTPGGESEGIRYADNNRRGPDGTLVFRPINAKNSLFIRQTAVERGAFSAQVNPGSYSLSFVPDDRELLPKKTWEPREFSRNTILSRTLLEPDNYTEIQGVLVQQVLSSSARKPSRERVSGAQVYAISTDGDYNSTVVSTDESGYFKLKVEPDSGSYDLYVLPASPDLPVPSAEFLDAFRAHAGRCTSADDDKAEACNLGNLNLGTVTDHPSSLRVQLQTPSGFEDEFGWRGTMLLVEGPLGNGSFEQKYTVDEDGIVDLSVFAPIDHLLPQDPAPPEDLRPSTPASRAYTLEVVPPADSPFARTKMTIPADLSNIAIPKLELRLKHQLDGQILAADGAPLGGATLQFQRLSEPPQPVASDEAPPQDEEPDSNTDPQEVEDPHDLRRFSLTTDEAGRFQVWLLDAAHQVTVIPPQSSGQPRLHAVLEPDDISGQGQLELTLPEPTVISGGVFILDIDEEKEKLVGLADVAVEAYKEIDGKSVVMGQARSNEKGEFKMTLPWD